MTHLVGNESLLAADKNNINSNWFVYGVTERSAEQARGHYGGERNLILQAESNFSISERLGGLERSTKVDDPFCYDQGNLTPLHLCCTVKSEATLSFHPIIHCHQVKWNKGRMLHNNYTVPEVPAPPPQSISSV